MQDHIRIASSVLLMTPYIRVKAVIVDTFLHILRMVVLEKIQNKNRISCTNMRHILNKPELRVMSRGPVVNKQDNNQRLVL